MLMCEKGKGEGGCLVAVRSNAKLITRRVAATFATCLFSKRRFHRVLLRVLAQLGSRQRRHVSDNGSRGVVVDQRTFATGDQVIMDRGVATTQAAQTGAHNASN